jgi:hypothetical protein
MVSKGGHFRPIAQATSLKTFFAFEAHENFYDSFIE